MSWRNNSADQLNPLTAPPETDVRNTERGEQNRNPKLLENGDKGELNDLLQDKLLGVQLSADIIQSGDSVGPKEEPQDIMTTWYRKYCKKHKVRARQPVLKRIRYACNQLNFKLQELGLTKDEFLPLICLIQECGRVEEVDFSFNSVGVFGLKVIRPILLNNPFLVVLYNKGLRLLDLSWNGFALRGTEALCEGLTRNKSLEELDLKSNRIELRAVLPLTKGLQQNSTLKVLRVGG
ncbi:leucine-rich repeat-containing protein LOC400891 homolog [Clonorchis sinensis]|uniref:Leucine-rich repeat-containing protein LOC400891 homolog n=1 Tax=Clonorchis sinensis TaxID=79923 RepID=G7YGV0_CLOSI|nr:leucine-rich repeat-containing protein LOC400891 homolog [Clonorchis sinensis]